MKMNDIPDKVLADLVRGGTYSRNTSFDAQHAKFLLVLAIPYGPEDEITDLKAAFTAFREFVSDYDWEERQIQVLTITSDGKPVVSESSYESLEDSAT